MQTAKPIQVSLHTSSLLFSYTHSNPITFTVTCPPYAHETKWQAKNEPPLWWFT